MAVTHRTRLHSEEMSHDSVPTLLRRLVVDVMELVSNEFALARREFIEAKASAHRALVAACVGLAMLLGGCLAIMAGIVLLVMRWLPAWIAALGLGAILVVAGWLVMNWMRRLIDVDDLELSKTRRSVQNDIEVITRRDP